MEGSAMGPKTGWGGRVEFCAGGMMVSFWEESIRFLRKEGNSLLWSKGQIVGPLSRLGCR